MANIMIITDDVDFAEALLSMTVPDAHSTTAVSRSDDALDEILRIRPELLLLDVTVPEDKAMSLALAREIRQIKSLRQIPIILLTGMNDEYPFNFRPQDLDSEWFPVSALIEKPVDLPVLRCKISELLERRNHQPERGLVS